MMIVTSRYKTEMIDITDAINEEIAKGGGGKIAHIFAQHTTCAIFISESKDPNVQRDLLKKLHQFFPSDGQYAHIGGNGDAHLKAAIMGQSLIVPIENGKVALGAMQGIFLADFDGPRERTILVSLLNG
ncbi:hypothetical protein FACS189487_06140 [Campylobacterota bacterium]|nr:hypothetical protein FACS189487_06140 [Campylobacterota bacterium]